MSTLPPSRGQAPEATPAGSDPVRGRPGATSDPAGPRAGEADIDAGGDLASELPAGLPDRGQWGERAKPYGLSIVACKAVEPPTGFEEQLDWIDTDGPEKTAIVAKEGAPHFQSFDPAKGLPLRKPYYAATSDEVDEAGRSAWEAHFTDLSRPASDRARLLSLIADQLDEVRGPLLAFAATETGLGEKRLAAEFARTLGTLRMFARMALDGSWRRSAIDRADPARQPLPRPELRRSLLPLGPVAVFGASNFPLAYSTAGGDVASALAAGCPVIVKGHPLHPGTGEIAAQAVARAVMMLGLHPGTFSFLHAGGKRERGVGEQLVRHPCVRAVGFTGSQSGGRALIEMSAARPDPIPVFCEMGSLNPVFLLPGAVETRTDLPDLLANSILASSGQQCTKPGLVFVIAGAKADSVIEQLGSVFARIEGMVMLAPRLHQRYALRLHAVHATEGVKLAAGSGEVRPHPGVNVTVPTPPKAPPALFTCDYATFAKHLTLHEEIFGPACVVVKCADEQELMMATGLLMGSLTASIFASDSDRELGSVLSLVLQQRAGRLVVNGVPTGLEVSEAMVHGGPYPATNQPHATAVGPRSIERWCRPVCFQNAPDWALPACLKVAGRADSAADWAVDATPSKEPLTFEDEPTAER